jgi:NAD(P)-dependent dehydrogenase (short-subunit alcohol dehydrogenase family)
VQGLKDFPAATGSRLLLVTIESTSTDDVAKAVKYIEAVGITHLDLVITNAGVCPAPEPLATVDVNDVTTTFNTNTIGPIILYQALWPLLKKSPASPKWLSVSTRIASLARLEVHGAFDLPAYGISKAGMNWFTL